MLAETLLVLLYFDVINHVGKKPSLEVLVNPEISIQDIDLQNPIRSNKFKTILRTDQKKMPLKNYLRSKTKQRMVDSNAQNSESLRYVCDNFKYHKCLETMDKCKWYLEEGWVTTDVKKAEFEYIEYEDGEKMKRKQIKVPLLDQYRRKKPSGSAGEVYAALKKMGVKLVPPGIPYRQRLAETL